MSNNLLSVGQLTKKARFEFSEEGCEILSLDRKTLLEVGEPAGRNLFLLRTHSEHAANKVSIDGP